MKLFELGQVLITPGALDFVEEHDGVDVVRLLGRHQSGDWGDLDPDDKKANDQAVQSGARIISAYKFGQDDDKIWIITTAVGDDDKRESTCILLPEDY